MVRCKRCGIKVFSLKQFCKQVEKELKLPVNPQNGSVIGAPRFRSGTYYRGTAEFEEFNKWCEIDYLYKELEKKRGFKCVNCGTVYCFNCLFEYGKPAPSGGRLCFKCDGGLSVLK